MGDHFPALRASLSSIPYGGTLVSAPYLSVGVEVVRRPRICTGEKLSSQDLPHGRTHPRHRRDRQVEWVRSQHLKWQLGLSHNRQLPDRTKPSFISCWESRLAETHPTLALIQPLNPLATAEHSSAPGLPCPGLQVRDVVDTAVSVLALLSRGTRKLAGRAALTGLS